MRFSFYASLKFAHESKNSNKVHKNRRNFIYKFEEKLSLLRLAAPLVFNCFHNLNTKSSRKIPQSKIRERFNPFRKKNSLARGNKQNRAKQKLKTKWAKENLPKFNEKFTSLSTLLSIHAVKEQYQRASY